MTTLSRTFGAVGFAVGDDLHFVARVGEKLIVFGTSFAGAGFEASGAMGDGVGGDLGQELVDEFGLFARLFGAGVDGLGGVTQGVEGTLAQRKKGTGKISASKCRFSSPKSPLSSKRLKKIGNEGFLSQSAKRASAGPTPDSSHARRGESGRGKGDRNILGQDGV